MAVGTTVNSPIDCRRTPPPLTIPRCESRSCHPARWASRSNADASRRGDDYFLLFRLRRGGLLLPRRVPARLALRCRLLRRGRGLRGQPRGFDEEAPVYLVRGAAGHEREL